MRSGRSGTARRVEVQRHSRAARACVAAAPDGILVDPDGDLAGVADLDQSRRGDRRRCGGEQGGEGSGQEGEACVHGGRGSREACDSTSAGRSTRFANVCRMCAGFTGARARASELLWRSGLGRDLAAAPARTPRAAGRPGIRWRSLMIDGRHRVDAEFLPVARPRTSAANCRTRASRGHARHPGPPRRRDRAARRATPGCAVTRGKREQRVLQCALFALQAGPVQQPVGVEGIPDARARRRR